MPNHASGRESDELASDESGSNGAISAQSPRPAAFRCGGASIGAARAFLPQRARRDREQRAELGCSAGCWRVAASNAAVDDEAQADRSEREPRETHARCSALERDEREDRLHAEYRREYAGREPAFACE